MIKSLIKRLNSAPLGITQPEINELVKLLNILEQHFSNPNATSIIRAMDPKTAMEFDEFQRFKTWKGGQQ